MTLRLVIAVAAVAGSPLSEDPSWTPTTFGYVVAFGWVPAVGLVEVVRRRRPGRVIDALGMLADFSLGFLALLAFPDVAALVLVGGLLGVAFYAYTCGWHCGSFAAVLALAVVGAPELVGSAVDLPVVTLAVYPVFLAATVVLLSAARAERREMSVVMGRAREKADAILTGVAEAVVITSPRGRVRQWNEAATLTFECGIDAAVTSACAEVLGLRREIEQLDCSEGCALLRARFDDLDNDDDITVWRLNAAGERQPLLAHVAPLLDDEGRVVEVIHSFRDITNLVRADEAKTVFLATASHELKTPLTVILGYSELMLRQRQLAPEAREQGLKAIHERARQLTDIVNRILLSSRIEAGRIDVEPMLADIRAAVEEAASSLISGYARSLVVDVSDELPDAFVDPAAVRTILDHLLDNAVKYSEPETPLTLRVGADDQWVVIEVTDIGIGMSPHEQAHCFERFWQAESGDVRRFGGTGIGLYIVKSLVDAMRGEVDVSSVPGAQTTFTVRLPRSSARLRAPHEAMDDTRPEPSIIREFMRQVGVAGPGGGT